MLDPSLELREAYITKLATLQVSGVTIPVYDEIMGGTVANIGYAQAYCLVTNQTGQDILVKNELNGYESNFNPLIFKTSFKLFYYKPSR
jgi:hypothetical protein